MAQVAVDLNKDGSFTIAELVEVKGSWVTIKVEGEERKVRKGQVAWDDDAEPDQEAVNALLEDLDEEDEDTRRGDVFPRGIRETYAKGKLESGKSFIDSGDPLAVELRGSDLMTVAKRAEQVLGERSAQGWIDFYTVDREAEGKKALNPGMVRMNLGNRIRAAIKRIEEEAAAA